jgi:hypothetical protein
MSCSPADIYQRFKEPAASIFMVEEQVTFLLVTEVAGSSEVLGYTYNTTLYHTSGNSNIQTS